MAYVDWYPISLYFQTPFTSYREDTTGTHYKVETEGHVLMLCTLHVWWYEAHYLGTIFGGDANRSFNNFPTRSWIKMFASQLGQLDKLDKSTCSFAEGQRSCTKGYVPPFIVPLWGLSGLTTSNQETLRAHILLFLHLYVLFSPTQQWWHSTVFQTVLCIQQVVVILMNGKCMHSRNKRNCGWFCYGPVSKEGMLNFWECSKSIKG